MQNILITGSSGTIGTRLSEILLEQNCSITGIDINANKWDGDVDKKTIIKDLRKPLHVDIKPDLIIHLAANARVYHLVENPELAKDNFDMLFNTLEFARKNDIENIIFASSREVYGNSKPFHHYHTEDEAYVKNCESPYTASKIGGEALVHSYHQCYGLNFIILRFSNVYGMYDDSDRVVPQFIRLTKENRDLVVYGKDKLLDFTYIDDCIEGVKKVIDNFSEIRNDTFNIASGNGTAILEIAQLIRSLMGATNKIIIKEKRIGEVIKFVADISKSKEKLGYEPKVTIVDGIKRAIEWHETYYFGHKNNAQKK